MLVRGRALSNSQRVTRSRKQDPWPLIVVSETYQEFRNAQSHNRISHHGRFMPLQAVWHLRHIDDQVVVLVTDGMCGRWPEQCRELLVRGDRYQWIEV